MSALFIAGNGFDIAHGIPSQYYNFREYIIRNYPKALIHRNSIRILDDFSELEPEEFAAEILLASMDKAEGEKWMDFEAALAKIQFEGKFPKPKHKEDETEEEDNALMREYLLDMDKLSSGYIACTAYWPLFFQEWIRELQIPIKVANYQVKQDLRKLFKEEDIMYGEGNADVFVGSSFLDDMIMSFKKDTSLPMIKHKKFFKALNKKIDKVYSYGFSYGKVDGVYIKRIIQNISPDAVWYFTEFEAQDKEGLRVKKVKLRNYGFKGMFGVF